MDFKEWLCRLSDYEHYTKRKSRIKWDSIDITIEMMVKAVWYINRRTNYKHRIVLEEDMIQVSEYKQGMNVKNFGYDNDNEAKVLEKALYYIFKNDK